MCLHSLKVAQLLRSTACLHTNQSRSYLNHLVYEDVVPGWDLKSKSTNYPDHGNHGDLRLPGKMSVTEPGIKPGTS